MSVNNDTLYSLAQLDLAGGPAAAATCPTPTAATTCCSSSTRGRTTSPTSVAGRRARPPAASCITPPGRDGRLPDGVHGHRGADRRRHDRRSLGRRRRRRRRPRCARCSTQFTPHPPLNGRTAGPRRAHRRTRRRRAPARSGSAAGSRPRRSRRPAPDAAYLAVALALGCSTTRRPTPTPSPSSRALRDGVAAGREHIEQADRIRRRGRAQRLAADAPPLRLQPRPLRGRHDRRAGVEDRRPRRPPT